MSGRRLRVCSLNIWGFFGDWDQRREIIAREWPRIDADVVLLQEVRRRSGVDQLRELSSCLGYPHWVRSATNVLGEGDDEGVAILSRLPLARLESLSLADSHPARAMVSATVSIDGLEIEVASTHTVFHPEPVLNQQLAQVTALEGQRVVIGGDLNTGPAHVAAYASERGLEDVLGDDETPTWPACGPEEFSRAWQQATGREPDFPIIPRRLDYLLTRGVVVHHAHAVAIGDPERGMGSDHACVLSDLELLA